MQLILRAKFTKLFGFQRPNVTAYLKKGGKFFDCLHLMHDKQYINVKHPIFIAFYNQNLDAKLGKSLDEIIQENKSLFLEIASSAEAEQRVVEKRSNNLDKATILTKNKVNDLGNLTLQEIIEQYGSQYNFNAEMQGYKDMLDVQYKANQVCKQRGQLIDAEVLTKTCKGYLDALAGALLTDFINWSMQEVAVLTDCSKQKQIALTDKFKNEISRQLKNTQNRTIKAIEKAQEV